MFLPSFSLLFYISLVFDIFSLFCRLSSLCSRLDTLFAFLFDLSSDAAAFAKRLGSAAPLHGLAARCGAWKQNRPQTGGLYKDRRSLLLGRENPRNRNISNSSLPKPPQENSQGTLGRPKGLLGWFGETRGFILEPPGRVLSNCFTFQSLSSLFSSLFFLPSLSLSLSTYPLL